VDLVNLVLFFSKKKKMGGDRRWASPISPDGEMGEALFFTQNDQIYLDFLFDQETPLDFFCASAHYKKQRGKTAR
jgi:hypothetical protein